MPRYFCFYGQTPNLSHAELQALSGTNSIVYHPELNVAEVELNSDTTATELQKKAGGIVKIARSLESFEHTGNPDQEKIVDLTLEYLEEASHYHSKRLSFAFAEIGRDHLPAIEVSDIKRRLADQDISARYHTGSRHGLSAALLSHQTLTEIIVIQTHTELFVTQTVTVQNIDDWSFRDRQKPYADRKKGMLPPKVARMMLNTALGQLPSMDTPRIYDPFCGTGTVLMEGLLRNVEVVGSDQDTTAILGCQNNLEWLIREYELSVPTPPVFVKDATQVSKRDLPELVDAIVTEPFLGKPKPQLAAVPGMIKGLEKLYLGTFKNWREILKPGAVVVMIWPKVVLGSKTFTLDSLIDKLGQLGYTTISEPIEYARPQAIIHRQIHQFRYQP